MEGSSTSSSTFHLSDDHHKKWVEAQDTLKRKLITEDDYNWKLGESEEDESSGVQVLKYIGGFDISFSKHHPSSACGTLVVLDFKTLNVVYEDSSIVTIDVPYVPGFLAFREAPVFVQLLKKMQDSSHSCYPQLLMIDGNGILHPRGFGSACHLGVLADLPTIGVGKNLHHVDGLTNSRVRELLEAEDNFNVGFIPLVGDSGNTLGAVRYHLHYIQVKGHLNQYLFQLATAYLLLLLLKSLKEHANTVCQSPSG
ncbi:endonuclease V isoform X3 [Helianthus annuus]|nr:endonuclease V isoform X3 [Helianthus annuus]